MVGKSFGIMTSTLVLSSLQLGEIFEVTSRNSPGLCETERSWTNFRSYIK